MIYAGSITITGLFLAGLWWYATQRRRLIDGDLDPQRIRQFMTELLITPSIGLVFIVLTLVLSVRLAGLTIVALLPVLYFVDKNFRRLQTLTGLRERTDERD